jgi:hypothetical protein
VTKECRRDKESVAKNHRDEIIGTRSSEQSQLERDHPERAREAFERRSGSRGELSTAAPLEAKSSMVWIPPISSRLSELLKLFTFL